MSYAPLGLSAALRRQWITAGDARQLPLSQAVLDAAAIGGMNVLESAEALTTYVLAPTRTCLLATTAARQQWLSESPLFTWAGPGNAVVFDDAAAALATLPMWIGLHELSPLLQRHRFAPRADDAIAVAVSALQLGAQAQALEQLLAQPGPDADNLHLSTLQCGRILAWCPHLLEWPVAETIVERLLGLLVPTGPRPLQLLAARALGPIAARTAPLADRVKATVHNILENCASAPGGNAGPSVGTGGLAALISQINHGGDREHAYFMARPARQLAQTCALILGHAAPLDPAGFGQLAETLLDRTTADERDSGDLFAPFVDGLLAGAHHHGLAALVAQLIEDHADDGQYGLALDVLQRFPIDDAAPWLVATTEHESNAVRADACKALTLVAHATVDIDAALVRRLADPALGVVCAAASALRQRGRASLLQAHAATEQHAGRRSIAFANCGTATTEVVGELAHAAVAAIERDDDLAGSSLAMLLHHALFASFEDAITANNLLRGAPATVLPLATAIAADAVAAAVRVPPALAADFAATIDLVAAADAALAPYAMFVAAAVSVGDIGLAHRVCGELLNDDGQGAIRLATLGLLDVRDDITGAAVAAHLSDDQAIADRVLAATIAGRALPFDHPAWHDIGELLQLGTTASAAAWTALRDRQR